MVLKNDNNNSKQLWIYKHHIGYIICNNSTYNDDDVTYVVTKIGKIQWTLSTFIYYMGPPK